MYVNTFTLLAKEVEPSLREFSMSAASLADSFGIALADICGILVQARPMSGCFSTYNVAKVLACLRLQCTKRWSVEGSVCCAGLSVPSQRSAWSSLQMWRYLRSKL